jgi:hypothetical protein
MASRHFIERTFQNGLRLGLDALGHGQPRGPTHPTVITRDPPGGSTAVPFADPSALQLDLLSSQIVEQPATLAEQHRDDMELECIPEAGRQRQLRDGGAVA